MELAILAIASRMSSAPLSLSTSPDGWRWPIAGPIPTARNFSSPKFRRLLKRHHTIFGQCQDLDVVKKIARMPTDPRTDRPFDPPKIIRIKIIDPRHPVASRSPTKPAPAEPIRSVRLAAVRVSRELQGASTVESARLRRADLCLAKSPRPQRLDTLPKSQSVTGGMPFWWEPAINAEEPSTLEEAGFNRARKRREPGRPARNPYNKCCMLD